MLLGAHFAGIAIEQSMLGAAHACANPLTAQYGVTHGLALAILLPHVVRWNASVVQDRYGALLGSPRRRARDEDAGETLARRLEDHRHRGAVDDVERRRRRGDRAAGACRPGRAAVDGHLQSPAVRRDRGAGNLQRGLLMADIRAARPADRAGAYYVCLKTGDHGKDGEALYRENPDALGRIFVGPYLAFEPELSLVLEDEEGICGYALGAFDSRTFYARYEAEWRPRLCRSFPRRRGIPSTGREPSTSTHVPPSGLLLPGPVRRVSLPPPHRPAAARAGPRAWPPHDRAGDGDAAAGADRPARISG